jgi:uncharacterized membrane protein
MVSEFKESEDLIPPRKAAPLPFYKKKWFVLLSIAMAPIGIAFLFILLFPVVRAIVQLVINKAALNVKVIQISQPQNNS